MSDGQTVYRWYQPAKFQELPPEEKKKAAGAGTCICIVIVVVIIVVALAVGGGLLLCETGVNPQCDKTMVSGGKSAQTEDDVSDVVIMNKFGTVKINTGSGGSDSLAAGKVFISRESTATEQPEQRVTPELKNGKLTAEYVVSKTQLHNDCRFCRRSNIVVKFTSLVGGGDLTVDNTAAHLEMMTVADLVPDTISLTVKYYNLEIMGEEPLTATNDITIEGGATVGDTQYVLNIKPAVTSLMGNVKIVNKGGNKNKAPRTAEIMGDVTAAMDITIEGGSGSVFNKKVMGQTVKPSLIAGRTLRLNFKDKVTAYMYGASPNVSTIITWTKSSTATSGFKITDGKLDLFAADCDSMMMNNKTAIAFAFPASNKAGAVNYDGGKPFLDDGYSLASVNKNDMMGFLSDSATYPDWSTYYYGILYCPGYNMDTSMSMNYQWVFVETPKDADDQPTINFASADMLSTTGSGSEGSESEGSESEGSESEGSESEGSR